MSDNHKTRSILLPHLLTLLQSRASSKTICPSEVARALSTEELTLIGVSTWRETMPMIRSIVAGMRNEGSVQILQKGQVLGGDLGTSLEHVVGPIRIRMINP